jgi:hypothetical protein
VTRLLIHIGLPKTGTTTLQSQLYWRNSASPVHYCHFFTKPTVQSRCFANTVGLGRDAIWDVGPDVYKNRSIPNYLEHVRGAIANGAQTLIISDETLSRVDYIHMARFRRLLQQLDEFCQIEFVMALRPWFSWLESLVNQAVKNGVFDFSEFNATSLTEVNKYATNLAKTYSFFRNGGQFNPGGRTYPVHLLYQTGNMLGDFEALVGETLFDPEEVKTQNKSPTVNQSLTRYFESKSFHTDLVNEREFDSFLSRRQVETLAENSQHWMTVLNELTQAGGYINDKDAFLQRAGEEGAIEFVQGLLKS